MTTYLTGITVQANRFTRSIGSGIGETAVAEILDFAQGAEERDFYKENPKSWWYVRLKKRGHEEAPQVGKIVDTWVEDESNVRRAAEHVQRPAKPANRSLVRAFGVYRFKALSESWPRRVDPSIDGEPQTMVCIALGDLGLGNGFFVDLRAGQDVCIDGKDKILVPPTGGGLAILFWIDI